MWKWFTVGWWKYLLEKANDPGYCSYWVRFKCRAQGHPNGPRYYNTTGYEPDWHCVICNDHLG